MSTVGIERIGKDHAGARGEVTRVLGEVDIAVADGELLVLVGPSGCGKSTLLRIIAGLDEPTRGRITLDGRDMTGVEPRDRDIAMVFQSYALYPHLSVRENLAFGLKMRRSATAEIEKRVAEAASMLGLEALLDRRPAQLSGGQRQRVAMGRAVVRHPRLFLFDEPLSNLDAALRAQMRLEILKLKRTVGTTMIYVTHDQVEAMTLADKIALLNKGAVEQLGTPDELYQRPATTFVARFLGAPEMSLLSAADARAAKLVGDLPPGAAVVGVRAEGLRPDAAGAEAVVEVVEHLGWEALVHMRAAGARLIMRVESAHCPRAGEPIKIAIAPGARHLFDEQGRRVPE